MDYETLSFILFVLVIAFLLYIKKQKKLITELQNDKTYFETYAKQKDSDFSILKTTCSNLEECIRKKDSDLKYILSGKKDAVKNYIEFLKQGGRIAPNEQLKITGVDLTKKEICDNAIKMFSDIVDKFEKTYNEYKRSGGGNE